MSINHLSFDFVLDTSTTNIVAEFYKPLLQGSVLYYRGVGYFSSSWIKSNAVGLAEFANNGGRIRWLVSPILSKDDFESLKIGEQAKCDVLIKDRL